VRRLGFNLLWMVSLLFLAAIIYLWVRTSTEPFQWEWTTTKGLEDSDWRQGKFCVGLGRAGYVTWVPEPNTSLRYFKSSSRFRTMDPGRFTYDHPFQYDPWTSGSSQTPPPLNARDYWWRGVQYSKFTFPHQSTMRQVWLPFWMIALVLSFVPLVRLVTWLRAFRRIRGGRCRACSYDLTGNTSGTCPECGSPVPSSSPTPQPESPSPR
jgi:hypothetical protein